MQTLSTTNSFGSCGLESATLKKCMGCRAIHYCGRECQIKHRKAHRDECRRISKEAALVAILKDAVDKPTGEDSPYLPDDDLPGEGASCWICLEEGPDEHGMRIRRGCACRGDSAGWAHPLCLAKYCRSKLKNGEDSEEQVDAWLQCPTCMTNYQGLLGLVLSSAFVSTMSDPLELNYVSYRAKTSLTKFLLNGFIRDRDIMGSPLAREDVTLARGLIEEVISGFEGDVHDMLPAESMMYHASAIHQLAAASQILGDLDTSLTLHRRVLSITKEALTLPDAVIVAVATLTTATNRHIESISGEKAPKVDAVAISTLETGIYTFLSNSSDESEIACDVREVLCDMLYSGERSDKAIEMMSRVIRTTERCLGPYHTKTELYRHRLAIYQKSIDSGADAENRVE